MSEHWFWLLVAAVAAAAAFAPEGRASAMVEAIGIVVTVGLASRRSRS